MTTVPVLTGIPHEPFEVVRPVMAIASDGLDAAQAAGHRIAQKLLGGPAGSTANPHAAFAVVVAQLSREAAAAGANAVIGVQFVPRVALANGFQAYELTAFGTAVRIGGSAALSSRAAGSFTLVTPAAPASGSLDDVPGDAAAPRVTQASTTPAEAYHWVDDLATAETARRPAERVVTDGDRRGYDYAPERHSVWVSLALFLLVLFAGCALLN